MEKAFSAPGRIELGGNHTDHQHGCVLAAAVDAQVRAWARPNGERVARIVSQGYPPLAVDLADLRPREGERGSSAGLVRGIAQEIVRRGYPVGGFDARVTSEVPAGSGLSSSAAYEVLVGNIFNHFFCGGKLSAVEIARIGQGAENRHFGKPCGLMDQMASSVGGCVFMDFSDPENPLVERVEYDFARSGHALCVVDTGSCHADLTDDYAAVPREMGAVAALFGKKVLGEVDEGEFRARLLEVRREAGDRAVLRAIHFFGESRRARREAEALRRGDLREFLALVEQSGLSSELYLQNTRSPAHPGEQAIPLALCRGRELLRGRGAIRVHGGGFAGTVLAFVPQEELEAFRAGMEALLGEGACRVLQVRAAGGGPVETAG